MTQSALTVPARTSTPLMYNQLTRLTRPRQVDVDKNGFEKPYSNRQHVYLSTGKEGTSDPPAPPCTRRADEFGIFTMIRMLLNMTYVSL